MKHKLVTLTPLILAAALAATAHATELKCKIEPNILSETEVEIPLSPAFVHAGRIGGIMSELTLLEGNQLKITVLEANKEIANATGPASVTQTARAVTSDGSKVEVTCSPK